jgi:hypothetical protein
VLALKALASKKHTGKLPADLAAFVLDAPLDRYSGKPFSYKGGPGGFVVYSTGKDQVDDGGDPATDLVFRVVM